MLKKLVFIPLVLLMGVFATAQDSFSTDDLMKIEKQEIRKIIKEDNSYLAGIQDLNEITEEQWSSVMNDLITMWEVRLTDMEEADSTNDVARIWSRIGLLTYHLD